MCLLLPILKSGCGVFELRISVDFESVDLLVLVNEVVLLGDSTLYVIIIFGLKSFSCSVVGSTNSLVFISSSSASSVATGTSGFSELLDTVVEMISST